MTKTTQRNADTLFNDISESFLGTPNVTKCSPASTKASSC